MSNGNGYTFLLWNGEYGGESNFVVQNNKTSEQSYFTPGRTADLVWAKADLTKDPSTKGWEDFANETVTDLGDVVF